MGLMDTSLPFDTDSSGQPVRQPLNQWYHTPNMERLATTGIRFTSFYAQSVSSPSRASLLTGQNAARHRTTNWINAESDNRTTYGPPQWNWQGVDCRQPLFTALLQAAGYRTIHIGKGHLGPIGSQAENPVHAGYHVNIAGSAIGEPGSYYGQDSYGQSLMVNGQWSIVNRAVPGLDRYHHTDTFLTDALTAEACREIQSAVADGQPFFLALSHYAVHNPFQPDPQYIDRYRGRGANVQAEAYATLIEGMDHSLGVILQQLQQLGIDRNTLVIFMSDNGGDAPLGGGEDYGSCAPYRGKKGSAYEGGMRVPCIISWAQPDNGAPAQQAMPVSQGAVQTQLATIMDIYPTVLDAARVPLPRRHTLDGSSLRRMMQAKPDSSHRPYFLMHFPHGDHRSNYFTAYRRDRWKLIYRYNPQHPDQPTAELYDLATDPYEHRDLAAAKPRLVRRLIREMARHLRAQHALYPVDSLGREIKPKIMVNGQSSMVNDSMFNAQLRSSRENLHLLSAKPVQILQASSRTKCQCSIAPDPWPAIDALGRQMPMADDTPLRTDKQRTVGIFYVTWHDEARHHRPAPYGGDVTRILQSAPEARLDANHPAWTEGTPHWGEPEAGYFLSQDRWLIRRDLSMLADAGVDVLILDVTNAVRYWDAWSVLFSEMAAMRALGNPVPQFCFWAFNGPVVSVVQELYDRIYRTGTARDFWFYWQGKPLLLYNAEPTHDANGGGYDTGAYPQEILDFFTLRNMWWGYYEWGGHRYVGTEDNWSFGYELNDPRVAALSPAELASRHQGRLEEMAVTPAQHPISITGKSWRRDTHEPPLNRYDLPDSAYVPWLGRTVAHPEGYGIYFQDRWDEALAADPDFIYLNDWNEWTAGRYPSGLAPDSQTEPGPTTFLGRDNPFYFVDQYNAEFNRTIQPMRGGYTDNYYMQMVQNIRRYKGVPPVPSIRGYRQTATFRDTRGDNLHRDHPGYGGYHYTDTTGRRDILECRVRVTKHHLEFQLITDQDDLMVNGQSSMVNGQSSRVENQISNLNNLLLLDTDSDPTTGWQGFDYRVLTNRLQRWDSTTHTWHDIMTVNGQSSPQGGTGGGLLVPRKLLGLLSPSFTLDFKWADSPADPDDIISIATTGDTAPNRRFRYRLHWHR